MYMFATVNIIYLGYAWTADMHKPIYGATCPAGKQREEEWTTCAIEQKWKVYMCMFFASCVISSIKCVTCTRVLLAVGGTSLCQGCHTYLF